MLINFFNRTNNQTNHAAKKSHIHFILTIAIINCIARFIITTAKYNRRARFIVATANLLAKRDHSTHVQLKLLMA